MAKQKPYHPEACVKTNILPWHLAWVLLLALPPSLQAAGGSPPPHKAKPTTPPAGHAAAAPAPHSTAAAKPASPTDAATRVRDAIAGAQNQLDHANSVLNSVSARFFPTESNLPGLEQATMAASATVQFTQHDLDTASSLLNDLASAENSPNQVNDDSLKTLAAATETLKNFDRAGLPQILLRDRSNLNNAALGLAAAVAKLNRVDRSGAHFPDLQDAADTDLKDISGCLAQIAIVAGDETHPGKLSAAAGGVFTYGGNLAGLLTQSVRALDLYNLASNSETNADKINAALVGDLPALQNLLTLRSRLVPTWQSLSGNAVLVRLADKTTASAAQNQFADLDNQFAVIIKKGPSWLDLTRAAVDRQTAEMMNIVGRRNNGAVLDARYDTIADSNRDFSEQLVKLGIEWNLALKALREGPAFDESTGVPAAVRLIESKQYDLAPAADVMKGADVLLDESLTGDMSQFVQDQVRLFYFTDVPRLMTALNPEARIFDARTTQAQQDAAQVRDQLVKSEADLAAQISLVNSARRRFLTINEQIREITAQCRDDARRQASQEALFDRLTAQKSAIDARAASAPASGKSRLEGEATRLANLLSDQTREKSDAEAETTAANRSRDSLLDEQKGLPAKLSQAHQDLEAAQGEVQRLRSLNASLAVQEADAFGAARDTTSYWFAPARRGSSDPVRRVMIFGYSNSKTLLIRGKAADVERTKDVIAGFDRPAPQALMTLWTLQVNGADTDRLNTVFSQIGGELLGVQNNVATLQDILQHCINEEVNLAAEEATREDPALTGRMARYLFYSPEVCQRMGFTVKRGLAGSLDADILRDETFVTQWTLPDPAHATTPGEMVFVLSLARPTHRLHVLTQYMNEVIARYGGRTTSSRPEDSVSKGSKHQRDQLYRYANTLLAVRTGLSKRMPAPEAITGSQNAGRTTEDRESPGGAPAYPAFPAAVLGALPGAIAAAAPAYDETAITSNQLEILLAIRAKAQESVANEIMFLIEQIGSVDRLHPADAYAGTAARVLRTQYTPLVGWLSSQELYQQAGQTDSYSRMGAKFLFPDEADPKAILTRGVSERLRAADSAAWQLAFLSATRNSLSRATPRVAAADEMIKRLTESARRDLDYFFVSPALDEIQSVVRHAGTSVQLGTIQRESVLATNRGLARVDPDANADVELAQSTDILQSATQLAQVAERFRSEQRSGLLSSGLTAGAGAQLVGKLLIPSVGIAAAAATLGSLTTLPAEPEGDVYSINSGNLFKVTPIFDPSGQALRFTFDFAGTTRIQEPDGSVNPQIPRVERHTVNTEVQLSNFELREVSRFEANAKLGLPLKRTGGIPILNQLPLVRDVPLLGYFTRRKAQGSTRQESLILAQTTVYPTVSDIVDLLVDVPPRSNLNLELPYDDAIPAYLRGAESSAHAALVNR